MKIAIAGGSGQVGTILARSLHARGDEVVVLSRRPAKVPWRVAPWDAASLGPWVRDVDGADVVINLVGRSVNCRYTTANRSEITQSRIDATRALVEAIMTAARAPRVWLQSSNATIYADRYDAPNDEATGLIGGTEPDVPSTWRFCIDVATSWERTADAFPLPATRLAAPGPLPNADFMRELRRAWGTRVGLPATRWMLEIGAAILKTGTELVLKSRRVVPGVLLTDGFAFTYREWAAAATELCARWRSTASSPPLASPYSPGCTRRPRE